ncbi:hypothetical protein [Solilutibacter silvestris]|uniref:Silver efflux pump n=1 Tax=Solilutibacter silvestris TaxID=1645665 RepID=A0A2K1Q424_9GAMM|nr:hypothetical protein [Lysobacter silvestris]PNS09697.1 hypothetical protein Lysil_1326 [Lysobacter silvestris]
MNTQIKNASGLSVALAAAALFMTAPIVQAADSGSAPMGHCMGANACKGQGACKSTSNACKGQNACKGKGFTEATKKDCKVAGGHFEKVKAATAEPAKS